MIVERSCRLKLKSKLLQAPELRLICPFRRLFKYLDNSNLAIREITIIQQKQHFGDILNLCLQYVQPTLLSLSQYDKQVVCVLSASGTVSNVTLQQPGSSGGTVTYQVCNQSTRARYLCSIYFFPFSPVFE